MKRHVSLGNPEIEARNAKIIRLHDAVGLNGSTIAQHLGIAKKTVYKVLGQHKRKPQ